MAKGNEAKKIVARAQSLLQTVEHFREIINDFEESSSDITELKIYLDLVKPTLENYRVVLEEFAAHNIQLDECPNIVEFTKNYVKLLADSERIIKKYDLESNLLNNKSDSVNSIRSSCSSSRTRDNVKLPRISLPKFNGNPSEYRSFIDTFEALIDSNKELSQIEKFLYLENSLTGTASYILKGMQASDASYSLAKDLLNERFCNRKLLVFSQLDALFDASVLTKEVYLRQFYDKFTAHCRALDNENINDAEYKAAVLAHVVQNKTDSKTSQAFSKAFPKAIPTLEEINKFLSIRCNVIDSANSSMQKQASLNKNFKQLNINKNFNYKAKNIQVHAQTVRNSCIMCKEHHFIAQCSKFLAMPAKVRSAKVRSLNGCFVCLRQHKGKCNSNESCRHCQRGHNSLLCFARVPRRTSPARSRADSDVASRNDHQQANEMPSTSTVCNFSANAETILPTAQLRAIGQGDIIEARVLLDTGSQSNFVTEDLCKRLNSPCHPINLKLNGINCSTATCTKYTLLKIASSTGRYQSTIKCLVIPKITSVLPRISFARNALKIPNNIRLADPSFNCSSGIDILIGSSTFFKLMLPDRTTLENSKLILQNTLLGWIVIGDMPNRHFSKSQATNSILATTCLNATSISELNQNIIKFWEVDNPKPLSKSSLLSPEERFCEQHFLDTIQSDQDGKLVVSIPFNQKLACLGESKAIAEKRFLNLEKRLHANPSLFREYSEFMSEYEDLGHMTKVSKEAISNASNTSSILDAHGGPINTVDIPCQYFPHHAVVKEASLTTKLRVVFDASAKSASGISVNDAQIVGPQVQDNLFDILLRFRSCEVALCGDIAKMYRMVQVNSAETKFQNILWRTSPSEKLETYRLNTITYGTASASFLATRCLQYIADSYKETFPEASKVISNHFYMDDLLFCANSIEHVLRIKAEVTNILATAGLIIRKFLSNKSEVLDTQTDSDTVDFTTVPIGERTDSKTLGLHWDSIRDLLFCKVELPDSPTLTKRGILSSVAKIYDPLGLYAPLVVRGKLLIQRLWQSKLDWDDQVPTEISTMWSELEREFRHLDNIKVPRCIIPATYVKLQLHGFADASSAAYGACIYVRCVTLDGRIFTNLLTSKSRVAPLRTMTIPRLELCAAVILSELVQKTLKILNVQFHDIFHWTDSQIVLNWINSCPSKYKIFVANRIAVIQELTELKSWRYVKGSDNPADIVSRGTSLADLATLNAKWFTGPSFLQYRDSDWNLPEFYVNANEQLESKNPSISTHVATHTVDPEFADLLFSRYSAFGKLQRVFAYMLRFIKNLKSNDKITGSLTVPELKAATTHLVRLCQQNSFNKEIQCLKLNKNIKDSSIQALNPFLDDANCVRVGGRIKNSNFAFDKKFPLLLPKNNKFTELVIDKYHKELLHCGSEQLLYSIRENYWPINGRYSIKRVIKRCVTCFKVKPTMLHPCMSNLPDARLQVVHPFYNTGLDYAGPILVKDRRTRGAKLQKAYICVFVCLTTRAVHLELLTSATSDAFISTLKRFIARRGKPNCLYSDNATTFRGAKTRIDALYDLVHQQQSEFMSYMNDESVNWRFINPRSPHEGGVWERSVQSVKYHLKRVLGNANLVFEDMYTVLVMIEAVLNSRPLSYLSSDPNDLTPITPGHFLIGRPLRSVAEPRYIKLPENRLSAYQRLQCITEHFWKRWCKEVVPELQRRTKWFKNLPDLLKVNSIVLLYEDGLPPLQWVMGKVTAVNRSSDGVIRTAALQLPSGNIVKRSVHRLCVLPSNENDS